jgi:hypothetical protein
LDHGCPLLAGCFGIAPSFTHGARLSSALRPHLTQGGLTWPDQANGNLDANDEATVRDVSEQQFECIVYTSNHQTGEPIDAGYANGSSIVWMRRTTSGMQPLL